MWRGHVLHFLSEFLAPFSELRNHVCFSLFTKQTILTEGNGPHMSSLRLALKQSLAESGHLLKKDKERERRRRRDDGEKRRKDKKRRQKIRQQLERVEASKRLNLPNEATSESLSSQLACCGEDGHSFHLTHSTERTGSVSSSTLLTSSGSSSEDSESDENSLSSCSVRGNGSSTSGTDVVNSFSSDNEETISDSSTEGDRVSMKGVFDSEVSTGDEQDDNSETILEVRTLSSQRTNDSKVSSKKMKNVGMCKKSSPEKSKAKTVPAPSDQIIFFMQEMSTEKQRRKITSGLRVKVRFEMKSNKKGNDGKRLRKIRWFGGLVSDVREDGKAIRIKYDDGTSEVADFPDNDIIVDCEGNGHHRVFPEAFIPPKRALYVPAVKPVLSSIRSCSPTGDRVGDRVGERSKSDSDFRTKRRRCDMSSNAGNRIPSEVSANVITYDEIESEADSQTKEFEISSQVTAQVVVLPNENSHFIANDSENSGVSVNAKRIRTDVQFERPETHEGTEISYDRLSSPVQAIPFSFKHVSANQPSEKINEPENNIGDDAEIGPSKALSDTKTNAAILSDSPSHVSLGRNCFSASETSQLQNWDAIHSNSHSEKPNSKKAISLKSRVLSGRDVPRVELFHDNEINLKEAIQNCDEETSSKESALDSSRTESDSREKHCLDIDTSYLSKTKSYTSENQIRSDKAQTDPSDLFNTSTKPFSFFPSSSLESAQMLKNARIVSEDSEQKSPSAGSEWEGHENASENFSEHAKVKKRKRDQVPNDMDGKVVGHSNVPMSSTIVKDLSNGLPSSSVFSTTVMTFRRNSGSSTSSDGPIVESGDQNHPRRDASAAHGESHSRENPYFRSQPQSSLEGNIREGAIDSVCAAVDLDSIQISRTERRAAKRANERIIAKDDIIPVHRNYRSRKKRGRKPRLRTSNPGGEFGDDDKEDERWVQCDRCKKWRLLPSSVRIGDLPERWYCELNIFDPKRNSCNDDEQTAEEIEHEKRNKKSKSSLSRKHFAKDHDVDSSFKNRKVSNQPKRSNFRLIEGDHLSSDDENSENVTIKRREIDVHVTNLSCQVGDKDDTESLMSDDTDLDMSERDTPKAKSAPIFVRKGRNVSLEDSGSLAGSDMGSENGVSSFGPAAKSRNKIRSRDRFRPRTFRGVKDGKSSKSPKNSDDESERQQWVQCEKCEKWRKLPPRVSASDLPDVWYCSMNTWDTKMAFCGAVEDKADSNVPEYTILSGSTSASISKPSGSTAGKLSYRNLIFGSGRKHRPVSERTRAAESLFSYHASGGSCENGYPSVMYVNSCAFIRRGAHSHRQAVDSNQRKSFFDLMGQSQLWSELYRGARAVQSLSSEYNERDDSCEESNPLHNAEESHMESIKLLILQSLGSNTLSAHDILLEIQCREFSMHQWRKLRAACTMEIVSSALQELQHDGLLETSKEERCGNISNGSTLFRQKSKTGSSHLASESDGFANSRCIKISKPWKKPRPCSGE